jgi:hypothetical protein
MNTEKHHAGIGIANSESPVGTVMTVGPCSLYLSYLQRCSWSL